MSAVATGTHQVSSIIDGRRLEDAPGGRQVSTNPARLDDQVAEILLGDASTFVDAARAARAAQREAVAAERVKAREAMLTGDERYLPAQHRGPAKRFARDYVDSRWNLGELLLPIALVVLLLGLVPRLQAVSLILVPALYVFALVVIVNGFFMARRINRLAVERFGESARGVGRYGALRSAQVRRFRMPKPMVRRGEPPA
jgi:hypothetical protein